ncbi:secretin N-terminal domain-containing protein [Sphingorhabdus arenilitoris]|uniref:Secretin N-terminal domain-containing protein n=1 Tax=Sphingorhabdus arenilitoris TaxID=1490041 RepID=A0ABV8RLE1_9SPHN
MTKRFLPLAVAMLTLSFSAMAMASEPPFPSKKIKLSPQQDSVQATVMDLFAQSGLKVKISNRISKKNLSATWIDTPSNIWRQMAKTFNMVAFYDGSVVRIYSADEISSRSFRSDAPATVVAQAQRQKLTGNGNSVKAGNGSVMASGVPEFLERIAQLSQTAAAPPVIASAEVTQAAITPAVPDGSTIVSPLNKPGQELSARRTLPKKYDPSSYEPDFSVSNRSTERQPYEVRTYFLKYAEAQDRTIVAGEDSIVIPGVASQITAIMGDGAVQSAEVIAKGNRQLPSRAEVDSGVLYGNDNANPFAPPVVVQKDRARPDPNGPRITAVADRNAVMIRDRPEAMEVYDGLIRTLDRPKVQVEIEAVILDLDVSKLSSLGIDLSFGVSALGGIFGGRLNDGGASLDLRSVDSLTSPAEFVTAQINALQNKGYARVEQRPRLITRDNEPAISDNRQIYPVVAQGERVAQIVNYRFGTFMKILPSVTRETDSLMVRLNIDVRDGQLIGIQPNSNLPIIKNNLLTTATDIREGESLIIGGISIEETTRTKRGLPIIGTRTKGYRRIERIVIITPRILSNRAGPEVASDAQGANFNPIDLNKLPDTGGKKTRGERYD